MAKAKELKVRVENRPGILGEVASVLGEKKVNLRGAHAWAEGGQGFIRLVADKPAAAKKALAARGYRAAGRHCHRRTRPRGGGEPAAVRAALRCRRIGGGDGGGRQRSADRLRVQRHLARR